MNQQLKTFLDQELKEIKEHKKRFSAIAAAFVISLGALAFSGSDEAAPIPKEEKPIQVDKAAQNKKPDNKKKVEPKFKNIKGLEKAASEIEIVNPFKVDIAKEEKPVESKPVEVPKIPTPIPTPPVTPKEKIESTKPVEPEEKVVLILKCAVIKGDKKMAIIQRSISTKNDSQKSKSSSDKIDKNKPENLTLKIGDEIEGKFIIEINKNFVMFDDGERLYVQKD